jgi:hypothetical protein
MTVGRMDVRGAQLRLEVRNSASRSEPLPPRPFAVGLGLVRVHTWLTYVCEV